MQHGGLKSRPSGDQAKLEQRLKSDGIVVTVPNQLSIAQRVWARWVDEDTGHLLRVNGPGSPEQYPGWHPGWIVGPDPTGTRANAYIVKYKEDDGSTSERKNVWFEKIKIRACACVVHADCHCS